MYKQLTQLNKRKEKKKKKPKGLEDLNRHFSKKIKIYGWPKNT